MMDKMREEILRIDGVKDGKDNRGASSPTWLGGSDSLICETSIAVVEVCKKAGLFLWAGPESPHVHTPGSEKSADGSQTFYCLGQASPCPDDAVLYDGPTHGITRANSPLWVTQELFNQLNKEIEDERSEVRRVSSWPIPRCFVYFDVSDFSKEKAAKEVFIIKSLISLATRNEYWPGGYTKMAKDDVEASLCIGDGYIFVFQKIWCAAFFAGYLASLVELLIANEKVEVEFHFRVGVHIGPVYCFWDFGRGKKGDWNYIGDGINEGQRVLAAIGKDKDDVVFISGEARRALQKASESGSPIPIILDNLHNRGRVADKHGKFRRVYELNHTDAFGRYLKDAGFR